MIMRRNTRWGPSVAYTKAERALVKAAREVYDERRVRGNTPDKAMTRVTDVTERSLIPTLMEDEKRLGISR